MEQRNSTVIWMLWGKICLWSLLFLISVFSFYKLAKNPFVNDTAFKGQTAAESSIYENQHNIIVDLIDDLSTNKIETIFERIDLLQDESLPEEIKEYFDDLHKYILVQELKNYENSSIAQSYLVQQLPDAKKIKKKDVEKIIRQLHDSDIETDYFIKKSVVITNYLSAVQIKDNAEDIAAKIPYYLIKRYDSHAKDKEQKNLVNVYEEYLTKFTYGKQNLEKDSADIYCLCVFARYQAARSNTKDLSNLKRDIETFVGTYPNQISKDNGSYKIQAAYLDNAINILNLKPNKKGHFSKKLNSYSM